MTFKQWIDDHFRTQESRSLIEVMMNSFLAANTHEVSALHALWFIKQCSGAARFFSTENGAQERKIIGGTNQISECLARSIGVEKIHLNQVVYYIKQDVNTGCVVKTLDGNEYRSQFIVMALPPALLSKIHFDPFLPALKQQMIQKYPMGSVIKTVVYYKMNFWRKKGFCGTAYIDGLDDQHPVDQCYDDSKEDGSHPAIVGFCLGDKSRKILHLTPEQRKSVICKSYAEVFDDEDALHVSIS